MACEGHQKTPFWNRVLKIDVRDITLHRKTYFYLMRGRVWGVLLGRVWGGDFEDFSWDLKVIKKHRFRAGFKTSIFAI